MHITTIDLSPVFDAFSNWFAIIIVWLKSTNIKIWTFTFSMYDFAVMSVIFMTFFWSIVRFWAGSGTYDDLKDSEEATGFITSGDFDWWGDD